MHHIPNPGELRPARTVDPAPTTTHDGRGPSSLDPFVPDPDAPVPLLRLRGGRTPIPPEACLVSDCPVCTWRRAGLIPAAVR